MLFLSYFLRYSVFIFSFTYEPVFDIFPHFWFPWSSLDRYAYKKPTFKFQVIWGYKILADIVHTLYLKKMSIKHKISSFSKSTHPRYNIRHFGTGKVAAYQYDTICVKNV